MPSMFRVLVLFGLLVALCVVFTTVFSDIRRYKTVDLSKTIVLGTTAGGDLVRTSALGKGSRAADPSPGYNGTIKPVLPCQGPMAAYLLILVGSPVKNFHKRTVVRSTWGNITSHNGYTIKVIFYMGKAANGSQQQRLELESKTYNDIVQSDIDDGYYNLTLKNLDGFKWALTECPVARFVLKIDDDVFVYPKNTVDYINTLKIQDERTLYYGYGMSANPAFRNKGSRWYISYETYKNDTYPPYNLGFAVLFSMKVVKDIHDASFKAPSYFKVKRNFPFEDVFMGICAKYVGIVPKFVYDRFYRDPGVLYKAIDKSNCTHMSAIAAHEVDPKKFAGYLQMSEIVRGWKNCTS